MSRFQIDYYEASSVLAWLSWVPNLIIAEIYLARQSKRWSSL